MRTITVPAGIGDFLWLAQKLVHTGEKFNIKLPDSTPQRGHQILELMPDLVAGYEYVPGLSYSKLALANIQNRKRKWSRITPQEFALSANQHMEAGMRLEDFLPDLPTAYKLNFATTAADRIKARDYLPHGPKYIGIYGSAYKNARHSHYNGYGPAEWLDLIKRLYAGNNEFVFVIIGAVYDEDLAGMLMLELMDTKIRFVNTIGAPLSVVIEILKKLHYFIGFPSGLSILNELLGKDGTMFYGHKVAGIINTWADPVRIKNDNIKECLFCPVDEIFNWLKNDYKIFDR
jgi:ADP-heptose:LPS heptosyltransferase